MSQQHVGHVDGLGAPLDQAEQLHALLTEPEPGVLAGPHRVEGREDQLARGLRHARRGPAGRAGQESRGRLVARTDTRPGVGRDGQGLGGHVAQVAGAAQVQGPAGALGQVGVDRFADQVVPERQAAVPVVVQEAGADRLAQAAGDLCGGMAGQQSSCVLGGERLAEDGGDGHELSRGRAEFAETTADAENEFRGNVGVVVRPGPDHALQDLGREERVAADAVQQAAQAGRREAVEPVLGHGCDVGRTKGTELDDVDPGPGEARPLEVLSQAFPGTPAGQQPHDRGTGQAGREGPQDEPAHRIRPLRVVDPDQERALLRPEREQAGDVLEQQQRLGRAGSQGEFRRGQDRPWPERSASSSGAAGEIRPIWSALLTPQANCIAAACSAIAANTADLPIPGSPSSTSTPPRPWVRTRRSTLSAVAMACERPRSTVLATGAALLVAVIGAAVAVAVTLALSRAESRPRPSW